MNLCLITLFMASYHEAINSFINARHHCSKKNNTPFTIKIVFLFVTMWGLAMAILVLLMFFIKGTNKIQLNVETWFVVALCNFMAVMGFLLVPHGMIRLEELKESPIRQKFTSVKHVFVGAVSLSMGLMFSYVILFLNLSVHFFP